MAKANTIRANAKILYRNLLDESANYYYDGDTIRYLN